MILEGQTRPKQGHETGAISRALAVATTTWSKVKPATTTQGQHNHLWILQEEGETLALKAALNETAWCRAFAGRWSWSGTRPIGDHGSSLSVGWDGWSRFRE
jgi:hypothetical protein